MDKYRRKNQISNEEINQFKAIEINVFKTKRQKPQKQPKRRLKLVTLNMAIFMVLLLITIGIVANGDENNNHLPPNNTIDDSYTFSQVNHSLFLIEAKETDFDFVFYYDFEIVQEGERTNYNALFDYYLPFHYVDDETRASIDVELNVFKYDQYRYFLEAIVNGEQTTYLEVNYFKYSFNINRDGLTLDEIDIVDFEEDLTTLYAWLEAYPPVQPYGESINVFDPHPEVTSFEDSRDKRNYLAYVEHYYSIENTYDDHETITGVQPRMILQQHLVLLDDHGTVIDFDFLSVINYGESSIPDAMHYLPLNYMFSFYPVGDTHPYPTSSIDLTEFLHDVQGWFARQVYQNETYYVYALINLHEADDLYAASYMVLDYTLGDAHDNLSGTLQESIFFYSRALIIPPVHIPVNSNEYVAFYDAFDTITITLYNEQDEVLHSFTITQPN